MIFLNLKNLNELKKKSKTFLNWLVSYHLESKLIIKALEVIHENYVCWQLHQSKLDTLIQSPSNRQLLIIKTDTIAREKNRTGFWLKHRLLLAIGH